MKEIIMKAKNVQNYCDQKNSQIEKHFFVLNTKCDKNSISLKTKTRNIDNINDSKTQEILPID